MSSLPYAKLLVKVYAFPKSETEHIASILVEEDRSAIREAIKGLQEKSSGRRMQFAICRNYGLECQRMTLKEIASSFTPPVSGGWVQQLRVRAERYLRNMTTLRPVVEKIINANIEGRWTDCTMRLPTPDQIAALKAKAKESSSDPNAAWCSISIDVAGFSARTRNCLRSANVETLGELCHKTEAELLRAQNFGRQSLIEVKKFLASIDRHLGYFEAAKSFKR